MSKRLFIAFPACVEIVTLCDELRVGNLQLPGTKWTPQKNLHLTLFFLGETDTEFIPDILSVMDHVLLSTQNFNLEYETIAFEGARPGHPSMVWARFKKQPIFSKLVAEFSKQLTPYIQKASKFTDPVPHITLARIRSGPLPQLQTIPGCTININGFELWESIKIPGGVEYQVLDKKYRD